MGITLKVLLVAALVSQAAGFSAQLQTAPSQTAVVSPPPAAPLSVPPPPLPSGREPPEVNPMSRRSDYVGRTWWDGPYSPYVQTPTGTFLTYTDESTRQAMAAGFRPKTFTNDWWEEKTTIDTGVGQFETYTDKHRRLARGGR